jgi:hypothetical protein
VTDEEHAASLVSFYLQFGDVLTTDECIAGFIPVNDRPVNDKAAA